MEKHEIESYKLHARMPGFKRKVEKSKDIIKEFLTVASNPYIAWSTGKDSTVVLGLTRGIKNITAVHLDGGVELPGTKETRNKIDNVIHYQSPQSFLYVAGQYGLDSKETRKGNFFKEFEDSHDFDGVIMGLRMDESNIRKYNAKRGAIYQRKDGYHVCQPILNWTMTDVFAYLFTENLPIHPHYLLKGPFPTSERRVGSYVSSRNRGAEFGRFVKLKYFYPELYRELVDKFPELKKYS